MNRKVAVVAAVMFGIFLGGSVMAEDARKPSLDEQFAQIINSQKSIEQRLSTMEARQAMIMNAFGAFSNALRPGGMGGGMAAGSGCGPGAMPGGPQGFPPQEDPSKVYKIGMGQSSMEGKKDAKVTIVEFSDFQCPFSQRFHPVINDVLKAYPNDVNYVLKNFPLGFHPNAKPAAKASLAAREQGKYWEMVETLFDAKGNLAEENFKEYAKKIGLNVDKFMKDFKERDAEWEKVIAEDMSMAGSVSVGGTPTFFINGKKTMARDLQGYKTEIDAILKGGNKVK